jgi:Na+/H+ antiporter NhaD/arsenite permease-like protein
MIAVFVAGYVLIAMEHVIDVNKSATALLLGVVLWVLGVGYLPDVNGELIHHLGEVSEILFFLVGAMTIVETVDVYGGFRIITDRIKTTRKTSLLWIISLITFFMSAVLDNLTTSILMIALLRKLVGDRKERWVFAGIVILAANSGGAWSPIGDVTTIMLWIAGKVSAVHIIETTFIASFVSLVVPLAIISFSMKGSVLRPEASTGGESQAVLPSGERLLVFCVGIGALIFVPIFKMITHLPPYFGMLGGLSVLWIVTGFVCKRNPGRDNSRLSVNYVFSRIDISSILFFLGILMAVNALSSCGQLSALSASLDRIPFVEPGKYYFITFVIGILSSIVDNVPLVAGAIKMYADFPMDHYFWAFLAYAAGTGGSILIIGSAAGVAVMGMEKIDFIWYLKKISFLALAGYVAGCGVYVLQETVMMM